MGSRRMKRSQEGRDSMETESTGLPMAGYRSRKQMRWSQFSTMRRVLLRWLFPVSETVLVMAARR
ncbi:hypothetical protein K458DRAFT_413601 [Lentithecium fluviatile CBS 122367]|uniref:Uncharacterized protein n=1 Tax=Lentithecium fluviatile CBS 122367 TaxID=1168545 RepID=A0A6G1JFF9_9PLEO|nr:hypothetical protein K458DRAFT_413601 [Lentithecium fluviatile CBS 122367]